MSTRFAAWRRRLLRREAPSPSAWRIILWWEIRRIAYNALVGLAGVATILLILVAEDLHSRFFGPHDMETAAYFMAFAMAICYALMANVCYTLGWIGELFARRFKPGLLPYFQTRALAHGLLFSLLLTLVPGFGILAECLVLILIKQFA